MSLFALWALDWLIEAQRAKSPLLNKTIMSVYLWIALSNSIFQIESKVFVKFCLSEIVLTLTRMKTIPEFTSNVILTAIITIIISNPPLNKPDLSLLSNSLFYAFTAYSLHSCLISPLPPTYHHLPVQTLPWDFNLLRIGFSIN